MHGLVVLDEADHVIRPAILWNDGRTEKETEVLKSGDRKGRLFPNIRRILRLQALQHRRFYG